MVETLLCCTDCALWSINQGFMYSHEKAAGHKIVAVKMEWVEERK